tara:strand:+ start:25417 stop:25560 length:144 start_codon:yes stop_codon:yes gene_type:complete
MDLLKNHHALALTLLADYDTETINNIIDEVIALDKIINKLELTIGEE